MERGEEMEGIAELSVFQPFSLSTPTFTPPSSLSFPLSHSYPIPPAVFKWSALTPLLLFQCIPITTYYK